MPQFPVAVLFSLNSEEASSRIQNSLDFFGKEEPVWGSSEYFEFSPSLVQGEHDLLQRLSGIVNQTQQSNAIVVSDQLTTREGGIECKANELTREIRRMFLPGGHLCGLVALVQQGKHRATDIDRLVDIGNLEPGVVKDAITKAANALRLKSPPIKQIQRREDAVIKVQVVQSKEQLRKCLEVRHQVYDLMGYLEEEVSSSPSGIEMDSFDQQAIHFAAIDNATGEVAGTVRLVLPHASPLTRGTVAASVKLTLGLQGEWCHSIAREVPEDIFRRKLNEPYFLPLPILQSSDFQDKWPAILREARDGAELSRNLVLPKYRGLGVSRLLIRMTIAMAFLLGKKFLLLECIPVHLRMYSRYGFERLEGHHCRAQELDQIAVGMRLELDDSPNNRAVGLGKHDIQMMLPGGHGSPLLLASRHLCLCRNKICWYQGHYRFKASKECPLQSIH